MNVASESDGRQSQCVTNIPVEFEIELDTFVFDVFCKINKNKALIPLIILKSSICDEWLLSRGAFV